MQNKVQNNLTKILQFTDIFNDTRLMQENEIVNYVVNSLRNAVFEIEGNSGNGTDSNETREKALINSFDLRDGAGPKGKNKLSLDAKLKKPEYLQSLAVHKYIQKDMTVDKAVIATLIEYGLDDSQYDKIKQQYYENRSDVKVYEKIVQHFKYAEGENDTDIT